MLVTDEALRDAIAEVVRIRSEEAGRQWSIGASRWDIAAVLAGHPEDVGGIPRDYPQLPEHVLLARLDEAARQGIVDGCRCGCRGDFVAVESTGL